MGVRLRGPWDAVISRTRPATLRARLRQHMNPAMRQSSKLISRALKTTVRRGMTPANAPLTRTIKRRGRPLTMTGRMRRSIKIKRIRNNIWFIGLLESDIGKEALRIAIGIHDGMEIRVTRRMRNMFSRLFDVTEGRKTPDMLTGRARILYEMAPGASWVPLAASTTHIIIPGRPWVMETFKDRALVDGVCKILQEALGRALSVKGA